MRHANFEITGEDNDRLVLRDLGPWNKFPTITNDAEWVVKQVGPKLFGRRLLYIDSEGEMDELVVRDGKFAAFRPGPRE